ncbi:hypothetical protein ACL02U_09610 [Streptomyces sp. MS06]|uniref:hypothetical protein n=1 Tax=Streptomyces sp. MS06 TaxID=3385974 RepID=UPI0039A2372E
MAETIYLLGEGGGIHAMDLPLPEPIQERLTKGMLRRVNKDGSPYTEKPAGPALGTPPGPGEQPPGLPTAEPAKNAPKAEWVGWAVVQGADAEQADGMTKADLIETYGTPSS